MKDPSGIKLYGKFSETKMNKTEPSLHTLLVSEIHYLKAEKGRLETELESSFRDLTSSLKPVAIVRELISGLSSDKTVQQSLAKTGLTLGTNLVIDLVLGKNKSIKGYLSSILVEKIASAFINSRAPEMIWNVSKMIFQKHNKN